MHKKKILISGKKIEEASKALILLHGRGSNAIDILSLSRHLRTSEFTLFAPEATNQTWYPYSFLAPVNQNEPWLSSAINILEDLVEEINAQGIKSQNIYFAGFSQGACLTLEFVARNAKRWGGVIAFTGGLIGDKIEENNYDGDFASTPIYIGTSDPDPHVPVERVRESEKILKKMNANVKVHVFKQMGHTIIPDEIEEANEWVLR